MMQEQKIPEITIRFESRKFENPQDAKVWNWNFEKKLTQIAGKIIKAYPKMPEGSLFLIRVSGLPITKILFDEDVIDPKIVGPRYFVKYMGFHLAKVITDSGIKTQYMQEKAVQLSGVQLTFKKSVFTMTRRSSQVRLYFTKIPTR